jgi:hypothetical protein
VTQAVVTQTAAVTTEINNSKDDSNNMTTDTTAGTQATALMRATAEPPTQ